MKENVDEEGCIKVPGVERNRNGLRSLAEKKKLDCFDVVVVVVEYRLLRTTMMANAFGMAAVSVVWLLYGCRAMRENERVREEYKAAAMGCYCAPRQHQQQHSTMMSSKRGDDGDDDGGGDVVAAVGRSSAGLLNPPKRCPSKL